MNHDSRAITIDVESAAACPCPVCRQEALKRFRVPGSEDGYTWTCQHCTAGSTLAEIRASQLSSAP